MKTIEVCEFTGDWRTVLESLDGIGVLVTRNGAPLARIVPAGANPQVLLIGSMRGKTLWDESDDLLSTGQWADADS